MEDEALTDMAHDMHRFGAFGAVRGLPIPGDIPVVVPVHRAAPPQPVVQDVAAATASALEPLRSRLSGRPRVAVTAGSRGIHDIATVVGAAVEWLRTAGAAPFVVPAMGSHGGGTAEGQLAVLADLGVHEAAVGAPVIATMDTVEVPGERNTGPLGPGRRRGRRGAAGQQGQAAHRLPGSDRERPGEDHGGRPR
jgi:hypothetical protein